MLKQYYTTSVFVVNETIILFLSLSLRLCTGSGGCAACHVRSWAPWHCRVSTVCVVNVVPPRPNAPCAPSVSRV